MKSILILMALALLTCATSEANAARRYRAASFSRARMLGPAAYGPAMMRSRTVSRCANGQCGR